MNISELVRDLVVLEFNDTAITNMRGKPDYIVLQGTFRPETCARTIAVMTGEQMAQLSDMSRVARKVMKGEEAYAYLLKFHCGLLSHKKFETHVVNQFRDNWQRFETAQPERAKRLKPLIDKILEDGKKIRANVIGSMLSPTRESSARHIADIKKPSNVFIIGGHPEMTVDIACAFGKHDTSNVKAMHISAPHWKNVSEAYADIVTAQQRQKITAEVTLDGWDASQTALAAADVVLICQAAGQQPEWDHKIIAALKRRRENQNRKVLHVRGDQVNLRTLSAPWIAKDVPGLITTPEIYAAWNGLRDRFEAKLKQADGACNTAAKMRVNGFVPIAGFLGIPGSVEAHLGVFLERSSATLARVSGMMRER